MQTVLITGDRSIDPALIALPVSISMIQWMHEYPGIQFLTGTNSGVEQAVRAIAEAAYMPIQVIENVEGENGKPDWIARHTKLVDSVDHVFFFHGDPLTSSIGKSLSVFPDDSVTYVLQALAAG